MLKKVSISLLNKSFLITYSNSVGREVTEKVEREELESILDKEQLKALDYSGEDSFYVDERKLY